MNNLKLAEIVGGVLLIILISIDIFVPKPHMPKEDQRRFDSLQQQNITLNKVIRKLDSVNVKYFDSITRLNSQMEQLSKDNTVIKHVYHEKIITIDKYNVSDLDSFFSKRYSQ